MKKMEKKWTKRSKTKQSSRSSEKGLNNAWQNYEGGDSEFQNDTPGRRNGSGRGDHQFNPQKGSNEITKIEENWIKDATGRHPEYLPEPQIGSRRVGDLGKSTITEKDLEGGEWNSTEKKPKKSGEEKFDPPPGLSDESSQEEGIVRRNARPTKTNEPSQFGNSIKHSVKKASADSEIAETRGSGLQEASTRFRMNLINFKNKKDLPIEPRLTLLERHLFRSKFGYRILEPDVSWNSSW